MLNRDVHYHFSLLQYSSEARQYVYFSCCVLCAFLWSEEIPDLSKTFSDSDESKVSLSDEIFHSRETSVVHCEDDWNQMSIVFNASKSYT